MAAFWKSVAVSVILLAAAAGIPGAADAAIRYDLTTRVFRLDARDVTYAFRVARHGKLRALYWGVRVDDAAAFPATPPTVELNPNDIAVGQVAQEYLGRGGGLDREASLKVGFANGNRDLVLHYRSRRIDDVSLIVRLADIAEAVEVELRYRIDEATGLVARSATVVNRTAKPVQVEQMMAAAYTLPVGDRYWLRYVTGRWTGEFTLHSRPINGAATMLESRHGTTGHQANPWVAIADDPATDENHGRVWIAALAWSSAWRIVTEQNEAGQVRVTGGFNPYDFGYRLRPGDQLESPVFYAGFVNGGFVNGGFGEASRRLNAFQRTHILSHRDGKLVPRKVLYNSWEATLFNVTEAGQIALADKAAQIGVERFVIDDGWFGARNDDHAGLGDWTVNPRKFPGGLRATINHVHGLGMEFGLWVEPEMVNRDSDLYRKHPDWVINFPGRPRSESRNQLVLNLARPEVRDHVLRVMDALLQDNRIDFIKWGHNRTWSEPGWPELAAGDQQRLYIDYVRNLYWVLAELRRRHPKVEWEGCAGGGGRIDLGMLAFVDQVWPSDNTDPVDRLAIQNGFTQAYAPAAMMAWVTGSPSWTKQRATSLRFRFLVAMQGGLGIGDNLDRLNPEDMAIATRMIADYKTIRQTVQQSALYRLIAPQSADGRSATLSVVGDRRQAVLLVFSTQRAVTTAPPTIALRGLDPALRYRAHMIDGVPVPTGIVAEASGAEWMANGVSIPLPEAYQAAGVVLEAVP